MRILVTGGAGFIGAHLVRALIKAGNEVSALDDCSRGSFKALSQMGLSTVWGVDIRDRQGVINSCKGIDEVIHLAYINGTKTFYEHPDLVLDVAVKGITNILEGCRVHGVKRFMLASSSEVCRAVVGNMDEGTPLVIPDPFNPRYSYSAGKIISEMMAIHSGLFDWLTIFRPYNIYGPGMSPGHVIPDFNEQLKARASWHPKDPIIPFEIIGSGDETRSFCYIDDFIDGVMTIRERGAHNEIYNIGTPEETTIRSLALQMGKIYGLDLNIIDGKQLREGSIQRRKPNITKLRILGYEPKVSLNEGLRRVLCQ